MNEFTGTVTALDQYHSGDQLLAQAIRVSPTVEFIPGQYLMIAHEEFRLRADSLKLKWTLYSIASSPRDKELEFIYTVKRTSGFTQFLAEHVKVGSVLLLKGPLGQFTLKKNTKEKLFVAAGAGIAPIMSMIRFLTAQGKTATLFYGFRTGAHYFFGPELEKLATSGQLQLHTTISRDDATWTGHHGYVQTLLNESSFTPKQQEVYICGNPAMVKEIRALFQEKGFSEEDVHVEQW